MGTSYVVRSNVTSLQLLGGKKRSVFLSFQVRNSFRVFNVSAYMSKRIGKRCYADLLFGRR